MNKSIRKVAFAAAIIAVAGYGVYENQSKETLSDVMLENVEALATGEGSGGVDCCDDTSVCKGAYCGMFFPADNGGSGVGIKMYYKI